MLTLLSFSAWCQRSSTEFEAKKSFEHNIERTEKMTSALLQMKEEQKKLTIIIELQLSLYG
jgi:hypothetical protein